MTEQAPPEAIEAALATCPFCGWQMTLVHSHVQGEGSYIAHTPRWGGNNCGLNTFSDFRLEAGTDLIAAWNTRAGAASTKGMG